MEDAWFGPGKQDMLVVQPRSFWSRNYDIERCKGDFETLLLVVHFGPPFWQTRLAFSLGDVTVFGCQVVLKTMLASSKWIGVSLLVDMVMYSFWILGLRWNYMHISIKFKHYLMCLYWIIGKYRLMTIKLFVGNYEKPEYAIIGN